MTAPAEIVRQSMIAFNEGGVEALLEFGDENLEWRNADAAAGGVYRGHEAVRRLFDVEFAEALEEMQQIPEETFELGDGRVLAFTRFKAIGKGSGIRIDEKWAFIATIEDDRILLVETYTDRATARVAAGLPPEGA